MIFNSSEKAKGFFMKSNASVEERFDGWYVKPINLLRDGLPDGDGGVLALSAALFLCERYYRVLTNTHDKFDDKSNKIFKNEAAKDLGLKEEDFEAFWRVYRNGSQHQGIPINVKYNDKTYQWRTHKDFNAIPSFHAMGNNTYEIRLNPWKFADLIIEKYKKDTSTLKKFFEHAFAVVT
jgi:hypothetical protein